MKSKRSTLWILNPWKDLGLFVLAPLWAIPILWTAKAHFDANGFGAALLAIGGTGHHLPGFIRAYTDPVLFKRFRTRFILAPLLLLSVYVIFSFLKLESLKLILILWGTWHGAMQVNGFLRIYDGKVSSFSKSTSWLDWAMCLVWFGGALFYSSRLIVILTYLFHAGSGPLSASVFFSLRQVWMIALIAVTIAFAANTWKEVRAGRPPNPVKLLMMVSSFALWWFAMVAVDSILVGLLLFEIVHDVQYNALVWVYNERRVEQHRTASRIEKFLFQPGMTRVLLYVAMILFYGSIADILGYANVQAPNALQLSVNAVSFWTGLFMVSTFLHFYFDGFIWQVREKEFRESIGIGNGGVVPNRPSPNRRFAEGLQVSWKWAFFLIPVSILGVTEYKETPIPLLAQAQNALELLPNRWQANAIVGSLEKATGDEVHAIEHLLRAVALNPSYSFGETMLADLYERRGDDDLALEHSKRAAELNPDNYELQNSLGKALVNRGQLKAAIPHLQIAAQHIGNDANLNYILGAALIQQKRPVEGIPYLERAVYLDPREKKAWNYLGIALQDQGDLKEAEHYYRKALDVDPGYMPALQNLEQTQRLLGE